MQPIKSKIKSLPQKPGIYFKDHNNNVIYIGKASSLFDRVKSYFLSTKDPKINTIVAETADVDFILTGSEREAAFLENNFIQQYQPRFNLRLKDDKSFPYLKMTLQDNFPGIFLTRKIEPDEARYFGPFSPANQARKTIHLVTQSFGIRSCREKIPSQRKRPCLEHDLGLCSAPCVEFIDQNEYKERVQSALHFLDGHTDKLAPVLKTKMKEASDKQDFEQAAHWRDLIYSIEQVKDKPTLISIQAENEDIFGFAETESETLFYIFLKRKGKVIQSKSVLVEKPHAESKNRLLTDLLLRLYPDPSALPDKILLPFKPTEEKQLLHQLRSLKGSSIHLRIPKKGKGKTLVDLANKNAANLLHDKSSVNPQLTSLMISLDLEDYPDRIEGFDISNTGGKESVGSLVVFDNGYPNKDEYRKYKISSVEGPDDTASLEEVIRRRYARLLKEKKSLPHLILVDGGKGQLNAAKKALNDLGLMEIPIASIAKKEEVIYSPHHRSGLRLDRTSPALKLVQYIRDEAHRFALTFHRRRREKHSFASHLDSIPGLGPKKKSSLLERYKSLEEMNSAPLAELEKSIGKNVAKKLKKELKSIKI